MISGWSCLLVSLSQVYNSLLKTIVALTFQSNILEYRGAY